MCAQLSPKIYKASSDHVKSEIGDYHRYTPEQFAAAASARARQVEAEREFA